jgi:hypothetical protein
MARKLSNSPICIMSLEHKVRIILGGVERVRLTGSMKVNTVKTWHIPINTMPWVIIYSTKRSQRRHAVVYLQSDLRVCRQQ